MQELQETDIDRREWKEKTPCSQGYFYASCAFFIISEQFLPAFLQCHCSLNIVVNVNPVIHSLPRLVHGITEWLVRRYRLALVLVSTRVAHRLRPNIAH